ncbi:hypothetical protein [Botrimarina hoheduenensis]|uniref:Uncharacterized protein n=1 Tax=Botrimarina hoheduenensis TaxID=2528000 RepID=A0A5C5W7P7_9BACT|nr:hypothetical protein [Botrimarina hoheduenensis]TWT46918.1 hypothetical protein Pla111_20200 [Botrimarina hoheduenensis]
MVTASKIRCVVMVASAELEGMPERSTTRFRPSDLLPWADPHIRSLIEQLQDEVRQEQNAGTAIDLSSHAHTPLGQALLADSGI